jgi:hypothetical protein
MFKFLLPPTKFWLFLRKSHMFSVRFSHLETAGYPVVKIPQKSDISEDQRKQTVSQLLLHVKKGTLTVELSWRANLYTLIFLMSARERFQKVVGTIGAT